MFNIFNNIYFLIYYKLDNVLKLVEKFLGLLCYVLYEKVEKVNVKKEIGYLNDFIDLYRMWFDFELEIDFKIVSDVLFL